jgi:hypothetical protein
MKNSSVFQCKFLISVVFIFAALNLLGEVQVFGLYEFFLEPLLLIHLRALQTKCCAAPVAGGSTSVKTGSSRKDGEFKFLHLTSLSSLWQLIPIKSAIVWVCIIFTYFVI